MVWWLIKRWRETPKDYEQEMYGRGGEAFEKAKLYAKVAGYLEWIKVDKGDRVKRDQVMAFI